MPRFVLPHRWIRNPDEKLNAGFVQDNFEAVEQGVERSLTPFPVVAALPTVPTDGQVIYYLADSTNGVVWTLKYRAASASAYKWEFVGGGPLYGEVETDQATASAAYVALATAGPSVVLPLAGDYEVTLGMNGYNTNAAAQQLTMSYDIGGTGAVDADAIEAFLAPGSGAGRANFARTRRKAGLGAVTLTAKYRVTVGANGQFFDRWMLVRPIRVG